MTAHAILSPSGFARVIQCPASLIANLYEEGTASAASLEGSRLHEVAESKLRLFEKHLESRDTLPLFGDDEPDFVLLYDNEDDDKVNFYVEHCINIMRNAHHWGIEETFDLSCITDKVSAFGTADFWAYHSNGILEVCDYKSGRINVSPVANSQLSLYAIGAVRLLSKISPDAPIREIRLTVSQHGENVSEVISLAELNAREVAYQLAAREALSPSPEYVTGKYCEYCNFKAQCPRQREKFLSEFGSDCEPVPLSNRVNDAQLIQVLAKKKEVNDYLDAVEEYIKTKLLQGESIQGVMLKFAKGRKRIFDEDALKEFLFANHAELVKELLKPCAISEFEKRKIDIAQFIESSPDSARIIFAKNQAE